MLFPHVFSFAFLWHSEFPSFIVCLGQRSFTICNIVDVFLLSALRIVFWKARSVHLSCLTFRLTARRAFPVVCQPFSAFSNATLQMYHSYRLHLFRFSLEPFVHARVLETLCNIVIVVIRYLRCLGLNRSLILNRSFNNKIRNLLTRSVRSLSSCIPLQSQYTPSPLLCAKPQYTPSPWLCAKRPANLVRWRVRWKI